MFPAKTSHCMRVNLQLYKSLEGTKERSLQLCRGLSPQIFNWLRETTTKAINNWCETTFLFFSFFVICSKALITYKFPVHFFTNSCSFHKIFAQQSCVFYDLLNPLEKILTNVKNRFYPVIKYWCGFSLTYSAIYPPRWFWCELLSFDGSCENWLLFCVQMNKKDKMWFKKTTNTQQKCLIPEITDSKIHTNIFVHDMSFTHSGHVIACVTRRKRDDWETWETQMTLRPQQTHPWQQEADSVRVSHCVSVRKRIKEKKSHFTAVSEHAY